MCPPNELKCRKNYPDCECYNCKAIKENIMECDICVQPFRDSGIASCYACGNIICWRCAQKLTMCPYCRVSVVCSWQRNLAVEMLLKKLKLPCRYSRRGCCEYLLDTDRNKHEEKCIFAPLKCPLFPECIWRGDFDNISEHLQEKHSLSLLNADKVTVEIACIQRKVEETEKTLSKYVILLQCHSSFFFCKVILYKKVLKFVFLEVPNNGCNQKHTALLELFSSDITMKNTVEISDNMKCNKGIDIPCDKFMPSKIKNSNSESSAANASTVSSEISVNDFMEITPKNRICQPSQENHLLENSLKILISIKPLNQNE